MTDLQSSLSKTVNAWQCIPNTNKMVMLIGSSYTGRSTFAQLINKYQYKVKNPNLIFQKDKYSCQNVISAKSIKLQTTLPVVYKQQGAEKGNDGMSIVDVPSYCLTPENKKWTAYQQKLTLTLMSQKTSQVGFLLFIQQKNTRSNISSWTKTFFSFLEIFKDFPKQLLNSIGWVITKCGPQVTEDSISKRLKQMQATIKKQKNMDNEYIDIIFENIIKNQLFYIFRKCTDNEKQQEQIKNIYKELGKLANYKFDKEDLKDILSFSPEEQNIFDPYIRECQKNLTAVISYVNDCLKSPKWESKSFKEFISIKGNQIQRTTQPQFVSHQIKEKMRNKSTNFSVCQLIEAIKQYSFYVLKVYNQKSGKVSQLVNLTLKFPYFIAEENDKNNQFFFQQIIEVLNFKKYIDNKYSFDNIQQLLKRFKQNIYGQCCNKLKTLTKQNDNQAFYEACISLLQVTSDKGMQTFLEECKESLLKFRNPKQLLTKMAKDMQFITDKKGIFEAIIKIANTYQKLEKPEYLRQAAKIYQLALCPGNAIICLQKIQKGQTEKEAEQLIIYLVQALLFDSAKKMCYVKADKFINNRALFGNLLNNVIEAERKYMQNGAQNNLLLQEPVIPAKDLEAIRKRVAQIANSIPG